MIYTVTFNPCLDYVVQIDNMTLGEINRTKKEDIFPGGKGVNVSVILSNLGLTNKALGFVAGFTGTQLENSIRSYGCDTDFIHLEEGLSRINVKIYSEQESEINGQGPLITPEALETLYQKLDALQREDILILSGSVPNTLPQDIYETILQKLQGKGIRVVVDATKDLLKNTLPYQPFLMKPNHHELGELFGNSLQSDEEIIEHAKKLQELGARNVLISMADKGAILVTETGEILKELPPKGTVVNSVGAGDSMVAGFLAGYLQTGDYGKALELGIAAGSATAFTSWLATKDEIMRLMKYDE